MFEIKRKKPKGQEAENLFESMDEQELFRTIRDDLIRARTGIRLDEQTFKADRERFVTELDAYIDRIYGISDEKKERFHNYIIQYTFGYHVLTELMEADDISDIKVLSWDKVRIKQKGERKSTDITFWSPEDFKGFVEMIAVKNGINIGNLNAIQTFTDNHSSDKFIYRYNIATGIINSTEAPYLHIRKIPKAKADLEQLIGLGMLDRKQAKYLIRRMQEGYWIVSGKGASGKTTLLNAMIDEIPGNRSVLVVQENEELFSNRHPDMMFQHIEVRRGDRKINYSLKELVINGLLTDLDYIGIGEIKGEEALYFLTAALTGNLGFATVHSLSAPGALDKLADYCKWGSDYSKDEVMKLLTCVKTVVHMEDFKIREIMELNGWDEEKQNISFEIKYDRKAGIDRL